MMQADTQCVDSACVCLVSYMFVGHYRSSVNYWLVWKCFNLQPSPAFNPVSSLISRKLTSINYLDLQFLIISLSWWNKSKSPRLWKIQILFRIRCITEAIWHFILHLVPVGPRCGGRYIRNKSNIPWGRFLLYRFSGTEQHVDHQHTRDIQFLVELGHELVRPASVGDV